MLKLSAHNDPSNVESSKNLTAEQLKSLRFKRIMVRNTATMHNLKQRRATFDSFN